MSFGRSTTFAFVGKDQFSDVANKVERKSSGMAGKIGKAGKLAAVGFGVAAAGAAALGVAGMKAIKAAEEAGTANAKLGQVMKQMGYGKNAKAAQDYADSIEQVIAVDAVEIKSGQTKLATFADIAKSQKLMQRSTMLTADMAAAGFGSIESNAVGLGKALQDPIAGMSLLSKAGSLTKDEQKKIGDEFKRTGDKAAAQESILKALEKQVGGVAEASADSSVKMSLAFGDITESIGKALQPAFEKLAPVAIRISNWISNTAIPAVQKFAEGILPKLRDMFDSVKKAIEDNRPGLEQLGNILKVVAEFVMTKVLPAFIKWEGFVAKVLITALSKLGEILPPIIAGYLRFVATVIGAFRGFYTTVTGVLEGILTVAERTMGWIPGIGDKIKTAKAGFSSFRDDTISKLDSVKSGLESAAQKVDNFNSRATLKADTRDVADKIDAAKAKIASVNGKTVTVGVNLHFTKSGENYVRLPGSNRVVPLAAGGIVTRPTLALVGESGPEAVIPLSRSGGGVGSNVTININGGLDSSEAIARRVQTVLLDYKRRQGVALGLG